MHLIEISKLVPFGRYAKEKVGLVFRLKLETANHVSVVAKFVRAGFPSRYHVDVKVNPDVPRLIPNLEAALVQAEIAGLVASMHHRWDGRCGGRVEYAKIPRVGLDAEFDLTRLNSHLPDDDADFDRKPGKWVESGHLGE